MGFPGMNRLYMNGRTDHEEDPWRMPPSAPPSEAKSGRRGGFNWGNALLGFFGGPGVVNSFMTQRRAQREAEMEAQTEGRRMEALGNLGLTKDQISAFTAADASGAARDRSAPTPTEFDRLLAAAGIDPASPRAREMYLNRANSLGGSNVQLLPLPPEGRVAAVDRYTGAEIGAGSQQPVRVTSEAEVARLPSGTLFIGPDGRTRRKP